MRKFAAVMLLAGLTACTTPEQIAEQRAIQQQEDEETCFSYGFRPKTDGFRNCMLQLQLAREQRSYYNNNSYYYGGYYGYPHHRRGSSVGYYMGF